MDFLCIDGAHGEGGGQIVRSALTLAVITGNPIRLENIRARRKRPGLAAQHLAAVRAAAMLCNAETHGAELGSQTLEFVPRQFAQPGRYRFDVSEARQGGSAGASMLVLQTVLLPLALTAGESVIVFSGGTHVPLSPSFEYVHDVWLPTLASMGVRADLSLLRSGWYPVGQGEVRLRIPGKTAAQSLRPLHLETRGCLRQVTGRALAANLPAHIAERMAARAEVILAESGIPCAIEVAHLQAACAGAGLFLTAHYENCLAGFSALGQRGKPAETVAEEACDALLRHLRSCAALDQHLADQMILPAALSRGESLFSVEHLSPHLSTAAWLVERFGLARVAIVPAANQTARVQIHGSRWGDRQPGSRC